MKLFRWLVVVCFVSVLISVASTSLAAPSLPVTKLPVTSGTFALTGPPADAASTNGQWFQNISDSQQEYCTHEFYDNVTGSGGGNMSNIAISGRVSRVVGGNGGTPITEFDITATIFNDTAKDTLNWSASSNSHDEVRSVNMEDLYFGMLRDTKMTAEFAVSEHGTLPSIWTPPYIESDGEDIVSTNEDQLAWYCWNPDEQGAPGGAGDFRVPTWNFGDIPQGGSSTRVMKFVIFNGISLGDTRYAVIMDSYNNGTDVLVGRTTSLKVSTWIDTLASDAGIPYPHEGGGIPARSSDVSVFHNVDKMDFGDAPDNPLSPMYNTLLVNDGARHSINTNVYMGMLIDSEPDGLPSVGALLDDTDNLPDEDGVTLAGSLYPGLVAVADVTVSTNGFINGWMDFGSDGSWSQSEDYIIKDVPVTAGLNKLAFTVSTNAIATSNAYARFRFTTTSNTATTVTGYAPDGEVEDYMWVYQSGAEALDYGDAPDSYGTLAASTGASHVIAGPWLGDASNGPDPEADGQPDANALGDDSDGNDDERGVWIATGTELVRGVPTTFSVDVGNNVSSGGVVQIWVDWNRNGTFDHPAEEAFNSFLLNGHHEPTITAPSNAVPGSTFVRCRISSAGGLMPTGAAADGEVEDHSLTVANGYVNWGNLQWPTNQITGIIGTPSESIYGQVYQPGITEPLGQGAGITAQLGYSTDGSNPWDGSWTWFNTTFNAQRGNNDEYVGTVTIGSAGTYDYAYRYSRNNIDWTYGDIDGSNNGYTNTQAGSIVITALAPFSITNVNMVATSDTATVIWDAKDRVMYQLQYTTNLLTTNSWSNIGGQITGPTNSQTDTSATTTRFYRVIAPNAN